MTLEQWLESEQKLVWNNAEGMLRSGVNCKTIYKCIQDPDSLWSPPAILDKDWFTDVLKDGTAITYWPLEEE